MDSSTAPAASPALTQHPSLPSSPLFPPAEAPPPENTSSASPPAPIATTALPPGVSPSLPPPPLPIVTPVASPPLYSPPPPPPSIPAASTPPQPVPTASPPPTSHVSSPPFPSPAPPLPMPSPPSPVTAAPPPFAQPIQVPPVFSTPSPPVHLSQRPPQRPSRPSPGKQTQQPTPVPKPPPKESPPETTPAIRSPPTEHSPGGLSETPPSPADATAAPRIPPPAAPWYLQPNKTVAPFTGNSAPPQHQTGIGVINGSLPVAAGAHIRERTTAAPKSNAPVWIAGGATLAGVLLVVVLVWLLTRLPLRRKRVRSSTDGPNHSEVRNHIVSLQLNGRVNSDISITSSSFSRGRFTYDELAEATDGFSDAKLLGEGGFGYVHMGVLPNGRKIAVKQLKTGSQQGEREFRAELDVITRVHHKHLVALIGYCVTEAGRYLVYEFVPNNTLEFHLHRVGSGWPILDWATRMKIAIGSAKGIAYLHEDCSPKIIHRDIKAANILLDLDFDAKVSDFGLAKLFGDSSAQVTHISTRVVGTFGYLAPEYAATGKLTEKSDVYSYGVVLLELITGRPPIKRLDVDKNEGLVDSVRPLINQAIETGNYDRIVDIRLQNVYEHDQMTRMIRCAAACVRHSARLRPRMSQIVRTLEEDAPLTELDDEGTSPGDSRLHDEMSKFFKVLATQEYGVSKSTDATSEYGLYPSCSSSEFQQTR